MGNYHMSIKNETQDHYSYCFHYHPDWEGIREHGVLGPYGYAKHGQREILTTVYVRYGQDSANTCRYSPNLQRYYNGINKPQFYIRPIGDQVRLCCNNGGSQPWCPNFGLINRRQKAEQERRRREEERRRQEQQEARRREQERQEEEKRRRERERRIREEQQRRRQEEERRRREEEERRRRERIERERRIQKQIAEEAADLNNRLGRAAEKRLLETNLTGREQQHQRSHVLAQTVEDDAEGIQYDEEKIVATKFKMLLDTNNIQINKLEGLIQVPDVGDQIQMLFDQLISRYCAEADLVIWFHFSFDEATKFPVCSLTDKLEIVEALIRVILNNENAHLVDEIRKDATLHEKHALLIRLMAALKDRSRKLSTHLMGCCLDAFAGLSQTNKEYIEMIVFNNIWTPLEAIILLMRTNNISQEDLTEFLHMAQTYKISIGEATAAAKSEERTEILQDFVDSKDNKPLITVIEEMRQNNVPDTLLGKVEEIVEYVVSALPTCEGIDISDKINSGIQSLKGIDFNNIDTSQFGQILIGLSIAVKQEMNYFPRVTQLVSIVTLLLSKTSDHKGCLLEISTGEGKSCIVAMLAVILALRGSTVDIVTSSPLLAMRDVEEWSGYYKKFNLTAKAAFPMGLSKCKTPDEMDAIISSAYSADVVYGTVGNFAADTLRQEFEGKNIRGNRGFDAVIVDEVDYMTLDNGVQVTFLSHASSGMRHVEQVLASIWNQVCGCRPVDDAKSGDMLWCTGVQHFHKAVISALVGSETNENFNSWEVLKPAQNLGYIKDSDFKNLSLYETRIAEENAPDTTKEHTQNLIDKIMGKIGVEEARDLLKVIETAMDGVSFECYRIKSGRAELFGPMGEKTEKVRMLLLEKGLACELLTEEEMVEFVKTAIEDKIKYSHECNMPSKEDNTSDGVIFIPQFLKSYIQDRLYIFIKNALKAILMTRGREYTIDRSSADNNTDSPPHHFDCIIPVDFKASGILEKNKRWGDGLQQFLEMKHQLALTPLSTVTNYLSNFHFFKRYINGSGVYGVSGTLGGKSDCDFLTRHFKVCCYHIPTHKEKKLVELPMIQVEGGDGAWITQVCQRTKTVISPKPWCKGQVALIVCEDMKTASKLQASFVNNVCKQEHITLYTRSDKHNIEKRNFEPGEVIIATNLGGRGTDISVTSEANDSGGLFVLLTHFPSNRRVEKQIFGRTARKGQPGIAQMVLNYHSLARAYQGQSLDMMRQLREDYERDRIDNMETDELLTINIREKLFEVFCQRLSMVTKAYVDLGLQELGALTVSDISKLLEKLDNTQMMDCKPALNAFKETWAQWLILNEHRIENNEDVNQLIKDLESVLDQRQSQLEHGVSENFYDHTKQALGRMYLHEASHDRDCGTLAAWDRAIEADGAYKAIALYNKAYITINMAKDGYMDKAIELLKDTMKCVDVHVAENANTMMACHISSSNGKFEPHNDGETNFKRQLEIRISFFKMWLDYTDKAIKKLQKLKDDGEDAITEEKGIFALIEKPNHLEANELQELFSEGLQVVYEVKKKPRFCISALICAIIGVLQVFAGVLVCALSFGSASQIGLGLISEGVSDIIAGIEGMIKGTFDWAEWAISKSISIGLSLITAGFSKIKDAACAIAKGVKGLLTGAKSLSSVADDCLRAGKQMWTSTKTAVSSAAGALSKESVQKSVVTLTSNEVAKANMKQAGKYALQEVFTQGVVKGINVGISKGTEALFEKLLSERFNTEVEKGFRESEEMIVCLVQLIVCYGVPETTLKAQNPESYQIPSSNETIVHQQIKDICDRVVPELTTDNKIISTIFTRLKEVKDQMEGVLGKMDASGKLFTAVNVATEVGAHSVKFATMIQNIPTQKVMQESVIPEFKEDIEILLQHGDAPKYKSDARSMFPTVHAMKDKLIKTLTEKVASAFTDACAANMSSFLTDFAKGKLGKAVTGAMHKTTGRFETNYFFHKQQEQYHVQKLNSDIDSLAPKPISEQDLKNLTSRVQNIEETDKAPSILELKAMTASGHLGGKGLEIQTVDKDGSELSSVEFRGSDSGQETIKLRIVREDIQLEGEKTFFTKLKETVLGKENPWSGQFELIGENGKVTKLDTDEDNSLFYAVTMAAHPGLGTEELKEKARFLRSEVGDEILKHPEKYAALQRRQKEYEASYGETTFFSLPPKQTSRDVLRRSDAKVRELQRMDANVVDNSFTLTNMKISLEVKATELWTTVSSGDEEFLKDTLKASVSAIKNILTPVGGSSASTTYDGVSAPIPGSTKPVKRTLLYLPHQDIIQECSENLNARFSEMAKLWSQGAFVSMVIPLECDDEILASKHGNLYEVDSKEKLYEVYRNLVIECLTGSSEECNPARLLKLTMICSHPDSSMGILLDADLLKKESLESMESELVKPEGVSEGEEIPEDQDPRVGKTLKFDPQTGKRMEGPWNLSDDGLDAYYKLCYLVVLSKYKIANCLEEDIYQQLVTWVEQDDFLDNDGKEYNDILNAVKTMQ